MRNTLCRAGVVLLLLSLLATALSSSALAATSYFQGFETDTAGWFDNGGGVAERVASGQNDITAATGSYFALAPEALWSIGGSTYTNFGGYEDTFPAGGYYTSIAIYLNPNTGLTDGDEFDWSSAVNGPDGNHQRDFIFHVGYYAASDTTAFGSTSGDRFVITASNNGDDNSNPGAATSGAAVITTPGWYTFKHTFQSTASNVLQVTMTVTDASGNQVPDANWVLSSSEDIIPSAVGGNRYGWFDNQRFPILAFDDVTLASNDQVAPVTTATAENQDGTPYTFGTGTTQNVTVTLNATDEGGSGIETTIYSINGGANLTYVDPFTLSDEGTYNVSYWSVDFAGNSEAPHTVTVYIARTTAGLTALTLQFEQNSRSARLMTAALKWAGIGARIHSSGLEHAGLTVYLYHVYRERGVTLTYDQARILISLAQQIYG